MEYNTVSLQRHRLSMISLKIMSNCTSRPSINLLILSISKLSQIYGRTKRIFLSYSRLSNSSTTGNATGMPPGPLYWRSAQYVRHQTEQRVFPKPPKPTGMDSIQIAKATLHLFKASWRCVSPARIYNNDNCNIYINDRLCFGLRISRVTQRFDPHDLGWNI